MELKEKNRLFKSWECLQNLSAINELTNGVQQITRPKINKDMEDLNNIIDQKDKINIYGTFYPQNAEYTFSSAKDC